MQNLSYEITDDQNYLFAAGELSSRENEFLDDSRLKRMISARSVEDILKMLRETAYSRYVDELKESEFDLVVSSEFSNIASYLDSRLIKDHQAVLSVLFIPEEIHNYKTLGKALAVKENLQKLFLPLQHSYADTEAASKGQWPEHMDLFSRKLSLAAASIFLSGLSFREKEMELEKYYMLSLREQVKNISAPMIQDYFRYSIDMYNIKNVYRHWLAEESSALHDIILENGFLAKDFYTVVQKEGTEEFFKEVAKTMYRPLIVKGDQLITEHKDFSLIEKNEDIFYRILFDSAKYSSFNLEKVFDFFLRKKIEIKNLNIIYSGVLYGVDRDRLRHEVLILDEDKDRSNW